MSKKAVFHMSQYIFDQSVIEQISVKGQYFEKSLWPLVYILRDEHLKQAYIGETTDAIERMKAHLKNEDKMRLSEALLISSERFNKSATLDIESGLIRYMSADGKYDLVNGNIGIARHHYFQQKELYKNIFEDIWSELHRRSIVRKSLQEIDNSDLFKYSPYKALSIDQIVSLKEILQALADPTKEAVMVSGGAGTGKSVLAIFLFKLLKTDLDQFKFVELGLEEKEILALVRAVKNRFVDLKMGLVIPMSSFRKTISKVFQQVKGLKGSMVIGPSEVTKEQYDLLLVDESHRLRQRKVLGTYFKAFDESCNRLGLDPLESTELDWVLKQSKRAIFFYDKGQSIKPSDVPADAFESVAARSTTVKLRLKTQLRSRGGVTLERFVKRLLQQEPIAPEKLQVNGYELLLFDNLRQMQRALNKREQTDGLSRLVAGYAWPWLSKKNPAAFDIEIQDCQLRWNSKAVDWINSPSAFEEVGCIHTVQGYDLNYVGVIFGPEITYNKKAGRIEIRKEAYHDKNGKNGIKDPIQLHNYIIHIYSTLMLRAIKGAFVYVVDPDLRDYFSRYIDKYNPISENKMTKVLPLIQFEMGKGVLKEKSRHSIAVANNKFSLDSVRSFEPDKWVVCQVGPEGNDAAKVLMQIIYELPTAKDDNLNTHQHPNSEKILSTVNKKRAEAQWERISRQFLIDKLESTRYVEIQLKTKEGDYKTVLAHFEGLLDNSDEKIVQTENK